MTKNQRERAKAPRGSEARPVPDAPSAPPLSRRTLIFGGAGALVALSGFYLLSQGSIALAPVLLAVAFLLLFPLALVK
jgi:hypothetical protein